MARIDIHTAGVFVITCTPFSDDLSIDRSSIDKMVDFIFEKGADGLTILGMMGEAPKLTLAESVEVARSTLARASGKPVIVGVSAPGLAAIRELSHAVMDLGAAGVMVAPPSSLRSDDQIVEYYRQVVAQIGAEIPVAVQDFPLSTGVLITPRTLGRIFSELPSVVMLKHEDWPGLQKITDVREAEARGQRRTSILCGNAGTFLVEEMQRGADGAMTGFAYPEMMVDVCRLVRSGDTERAHDVFDAYLPLIRFEQQPGLGLAIRKYVLARRGVIASARQRLPGSALNPLAIAEVERLISRQERKLRLVAPSR
ncbi:MAG: dihydrodipicolinate synthase family protein [Lautropia sp.]